MRSIDSTPPRSRIETAVVHHGTRRDFIGFNRASHAVLEAAIYATRVHLLPRAFIDSELARLQVIVDKTAGARELEAMALLTEYVRSAPRRRSRRGARDGRSAGRGRGVRRGAGPPPLRGARPARLAGTLVRRHRRGGTGADAPRVGGAGRHAGGGRRGCRSRGRVRVPLPGPPRHRGAAPACACIARCPPTPDSARARSSRWPSRARWRSFTGSRRTRPASRAPCGRGRRSAIGTWTFAGGGLVRRGRTAPGPRRVRPTARPPALPAGLALRRRRAARRAGYQRRRRGGGASRSCRRRRSATSSASRTSC